MATPLQAVIQKISGEIKQLKQALPFADGQSYFNDQKRINKLQAELLYWQRIAKTVNETENVS